MPIYDYRCSDCGNTFEMLVKKDTVPPARNAKARISKNCFPSPLRLSCIPSRPASPADAEPAASIDGLPGCARKLSEPCATMN